MSARRTSNEELTKESILTTARQLFIANGFDKTSMRQVANKLQCSHGALYYHFSNKAELFNEIVTRDFLQLEQLIDEILVQQGSNEEKCRAILRKYIEFGITNKSHYEMMFMSKDGEAHLFHEQPMKSYEKFVSAIQTLCSETLSIQHLWSLFLSLHGFVSYYCFTDQTYDDMHPLVEAHIDFLMKGM